MAEGVSVTRERLTDLIGKNALAPHLNPVFEAIRDFGVRALIVPQCKDNLNDALDEAHDASIAIVGDDTDRALGPSGFHVSSMRRLFGMADHVAVIGSAPPVGVYAGLSAIASLERCFVVIVETRPEEEIAWVDFVKSANPELPILLVTTEAGRA